MFVHWLSNFCYALYVLNWPALCGLSFSSYLSFNFHQLPFPSSFYFRYRLRSKVDIENVAEDFSCWQRYGKNISEKSSFVEEPEATAVGWGGGVDHSGMATARGNNHGWQWFKDPRLDFLGYRGIFPSNTTRKSFEVCFLLRSIYCLQF